MNTFPANDQEQEAAADHIIIEPFHKDPETGALFVHKDLVKVQDAWAEEEHVGPVSLDERLGDVESWVAYVKKHSDTESFLTWSAAGLSAFIDYPHPHKWSAAYPFVQTVEFRRWSGLATGQSVELKKVVEFLEDNAPDIFEPSSAALLDLLRMLKANTNATADVELRENGTSRVKFERDSNVKGANDAELPSEITIAIPVLKGHVESEDDIDRGLVKGQPVRYKLVLKLRASVDANAKLSLRFNMPVMERVLEQVYAERVASAQALLDGWTIYRAAD